MKNGQPQTPPAVWIRGRDLRARWGKMSNTSFYDKLKRGLIPRPHFPFGPPTPYWSMADIESFEADAVARTAKASAAQAA